MATQSTLRRGIRRQLNPRVWLSLYLRMDTRDLLVVDELAVDATGYDGIECHLILGRDYCGAKLRSRITTNTKKEISLHDHAPLST